MKLFKKQPRSAAAAYTNFFVLSQLEVDGHELINRSAPEDSLLLQWGLPRKDAKYPAPNIKGWKPYFHGVKDHRYVDALKWIRGLYADLPERNYGIDGERLFEQSFIAEKTNVIADDF